MKVQLLPYEYKGKKGVDIEIISENATVADYYEALDEYILNGEIMRFRSETDHCEGCDICCGERMPLTSIDVFQIKKELASELTLGDFFNKYTYVTVAGRVIDILLRRDLEDKCIFLDKKKKKCTRYAIRPLVCRMYICTLLSDRAERLRQELINSGEDELVRQWVECLQNGEVSINEAEDIDIRPEDWLENAWTDKHSYNEILLRDILSTELMKTLSKKGEQIV